jgi:hypothetical protein
MRGWRRTVATGALAGLAALLGVAGLVPAPAAAVDSDLKFPYAFTVGASNGYSILAFAVNERADGHGQIVLTASRGAASATYLAPPG